LSPDGWGLSGSDLESLGIPTEEEYLAMYLRRVGVVGKPNPSEWSFYMAYNMFRMAGILRASWPARWPAAASAQALEASRRARPMAERDGRRSNHARVSLLSFTKVRDAQILKLVTPAQARNTGGPQNDPLAG
jgi:aminoglycoside phosphotransferase (APT) family kinase protein